MVILELIYFNIGNDKGYQHHQTLQQVQYYQDVPHHKQSLKCRLISDQHSENSSTMDDAQSIEGKTHTKCNITLKYFPRGRFSFRDFICRNISAKKIYKLLYLD